MAGRHQGRNERVKDDGRHDTHSKWVVHEDKCRPITTWRRYICDNVRSHANDWSRLEE